MLCGVDQRKLLTLSVDTPAGAARISVRRSENCMETFVGRARRRRDTLCCECSLVEASHTALCRSFLPLLRVDSKARCIFCRGAGTGAGRIWICPPASGSLVGAHKGKT